MGIRILIRHSILFQPSVEPTMGLFWGLNSMPTSGGLVFATIYYNSRYIAVIYNTTIHTQQSLQWYKLSHSRTTLDISPSRASCRVSKKYDRDMSKARCICIHNLYSFITFHSPCTTTFTTRVNAIFGHWLRLTLHCILAIGYDYSHMQICNDFDVS